MPPKLGGYRGLNQQKLYNMKESNSIKVGRSDPQPPNLGGIGEYDEIRPYEEGEMKQAFEDLINDRQFSRMLKGFRRLSVMACFDWPLRVSRHRSTSKSVS